MRANRTGFGLIAGSSAARGHRWGALALCLPLLVGIAPPPLHAAQATDEDMPAARDVAPVDRGDMPAKARRQQAASKTAATAAVQGAFGPVFGWNIIPIHMVLMPDGRMLAFGSNPKGSNTGNLYYSVWDPRLGTGADAFTLLPASIATDVFCAATAILPFSGEVLIGGGTRVVAGQRGYGNNATSLFTPSTNLMTSLTPMAYPRWYATLVTLADGNQVILGGRIDKTYPGPGAGGGATGRDTVAAYASTPERFDAGTRSWSVMGSAVSDKAYGSLAQSWYYPQAWVAPDARVFVLAHAGQTFDLAPATGALTQFGVSAAAADQRLSSVMYQPGRILSIRNRLQVVTIDINGAKPVITPTSPISRHRLYGNATVLADGKVFVNGGSSTGNLIDGNEHYDAEIWDPATGAWTPGPTAAKPRLYHSNALLMPDGTVVTGGGGAPGPVTNLNAEVYSPAYLFNADGSLAARPHIDAAPAVLGWGQSFAITVTSATPVSRVTLLRSGTATHGFNTSQRFFDLPFTRSGANIALSTPATAALAPPGYYLLFAFDGNGVPSPAQMIRLAP